jgi:hypothetical protein
MQVQKPSKSVNFTKVGAERGYFCNVPRKLARVEPRMLEDGGGRVGWCRKVARREREVRSGGKSRQIKRDVRNNGAFTPSNVRLNG